MNLESNYQKAIDGIEALEQYRDVLAKLLDQERKSPAPQETPMQQEEKPARRLKPYVVYILGKYVSEVRYCKGDDPESVDEEDWVYEMHKPLLLDIITTESKDSAIRCAANKYNVNPNSLNAISPI